MEHAEHEKAEKRYRPERFRRNPLARNGAVGDHDGGCRQQLAAVAHPPRHLHLRPQGGDAHRPDPAAPAAQGGIVAQLVAQSRQQHRPQHLRRRQPHKYRQQRRGPRRHPDPGPLRGPHSNRWDSHTPRPYGARSADGARWRCRYGPPPRWDPRAAPAGRRRR